MGQGQEYHARKMMTECMAGGGWVLLQNVHLSLNFCAEIIDILIETEHVQDTFRLWVTTEVHSEFPIVSKFLEKYIADVTIKFNLIVRVFYNLQSSLRMNHHREFVQA